MQKSVAFAQFGPNPNTGIVLMASGVQGRMAGLVFWKTPLPDQMVPGGLSSGSNGRPAQAGQVQQQRQANAPTWGGLQ